MHKTDVNGRPVHTACALEAELRPWHRQAIVGALRESRRWGAALPGEWGCCGPTIVHLILLDGHLSVYALHAPQCPAHDVDRPDEEWTRELSYPQAKPWPFRPDPSVTPVHNSAALEIDLHEYVLHIADALTASSEWRMSVPGHWGCCGTTPVNLGFSDYFDLYGNHRGRCEAHGTERPDADWLDERLEEARDSEQMHIGWYPDR